MPKHLTWGRFYWSMWAVCLLFAGFTTGCVDAIPLNEQTATYFGLKDQATFRYENMASQEMVQNYEKTDVDEESFVFFREATVGGFMVDDQTMVLEATDDRLKINQFYDCLTRCGVPTEPDSMITRPMTEGDDEQTDVTVEMTENGQAADSRTETHRFAVGAKRTKDLPVGAYEGFDVIWTRTTGGDTSTAALFVVPELGFGEIQLFTGENYALSSGP